MPKVLTQDQINRYQRDGAVAPVFLMSRTEIEAYRRKFDALEATIGGEAQARFRIKAHLPFPWLTELTRHPRMIDAVEDLIGPDVILWGSSFFTKKARDVRFVSWHQDSTYYGLEPPESITCWIGFTDARKESGCMRIVPGSHNGPAILPHVETYAKDNLLARGQTIQNVDESSLVYLEVDAGEFSIHHNKTIHSSQPNNADTPRIGFAVHFAAPHVRQVQFAGATATVLRGQDRFGHWQPEPQPKQDFDPVCLAAMDEAWARYRTSMKAQA
jgi:non-haem Fe2+, alpha-ketoglutarate-dependent halogenase